MQATLGHVHSLGNTINANCNICGKSRPLDMDWLIERYGPKFSVPDLNRFLRCSGCRTQNTAVRIATRQSAQVSSVGRVIAFEGGIRP